MKVESLMSPVVVANGINTGIVATMLTLSDGGEDSTLNSVLENIMACPLKTLLIEGYEELNGEVKQLIEGLSSKGFKIFLSINSNTTMEVFRTIPNVFFHWRIAKSYVDLQGFNPSNMTLLKNTDVISFEIDTDEEFNRLKEFLTETRLSTPQMEFYLGGKVNHPEVSVYASKLTTKNIRIFKR